MLYLKVYELRSSNGPCMAEQLWVGIKAAFERDSKTSQNVVFFLAQKYLRSTIDLHVCVVFTI